jgi:uncharacterized protein (TIGR03066 family)
MNAVRLALVGALWLGLIALAGAQDKDEDGDALKKKLIGRWEAVKGKGLPPGAIVVFHKDGKMVVTAREKDKDNDKERKIEGTYKVKGKSFQITFKRDEKERTQTIKVLKISDKELETEGEKGDKLTFKRLARKKE